MQKGVLCIFGGCVKMYEFCGYAFQRYYKCNYFLIWRGVMRVFSDLQVYFFKMILNAIIF